MTFVKDLDAPLLRLGPHDVFTLRDACAGVHIFGGIGSGKTSGSGKMLAGAYLRAGMGGLITAAKPEEAPLWQAYAKQHGRAQSLILFDENEGFNFLSYEMARHGIEGIGTVVECLLRVLEAARRANGSGAKQGGDPFWDDTARQALRYTITPLYAAHGSLSIADIIRFLSAAPETREEAHSPEWHSSSYLYEVMRKAGTQPCVPIPDGMLQGCTHYWTREFPGMHDKLRSSVVANVTTVLDRFKHGRLAKAFCGRTTIVPEMSMHGAIIVLAMPTLVWNEDGVIAQQLFKYCWQRAILTRNSLAKKHQERPVFLWSDEAQETVTSYDGEFLSLCRASKACTVYLTQSLPTYYAKIGGTIPQDTAKALVGKFMTHVYHANACPDTNDYASKMIGRVLTQRGSFNTSDSQTVTIGLNRGASEGHNSSWNFGASSSHGPQGGGGTNNGHSGGKNKGYNVGANRSKGNSSSVARGYSEAMDFAIESGDFASILKTGGSANRGEVTAVWFQGGRKFNKTGTNRLLQSFRQ